MKRRGLQLVGAFVAAGAILAAWMHPRDAAQVVASTDSPAASAGEEGSPAAPQAVPPTRSEGGKHRPKAKAKAAKHVSKESVDRVLARKMPSLEPEERTRLAHAIFDEARFAAIDPLFVLALIAVESGYDHGAESVRGARGLMQLRPSTLESEKERSKLEGDGDDPVVNVRAGVRYYARLLRAFGTHDLALMAYNAGPNRILRYLREEGEIPERLHKYPQRVHAEHSRLQRVPASSHVASARPAPAPAPTPAPPAATAPQSATSPPSS